MKIMTLEARYKGKINLLNLEAAKLPKRIGLVTAVQFVGFIKEVRQYLERYGKIVFADKSKQKYEGQILGCDTSAAKKINDDVDAFLYIGTGRFHPFGIALNTNKDVFLYEPINGTMSKIGKSEVEKYKIKMKSAYMKFLHANEVGILVSLKPGQYNLKGAIELKKKFKEKHFYVFAFDTLDFSEVENFPFIECWVNTACSRMTDDYEKFPKPLVSIMDVLC